MNEDARNIPIPQSIAIAMLLWAMLPFNPYGYYTFLRIVITGIAVYLAMHAFRDQKVGWGWALGIIAAVYNPMIPVHLTREIWTGVNLATVGLLAFSMRSVPVSARPSNGERTLC